MFKATNVLIEKNKVVKQSITCDGSQVTYGSALRLWASDAEFREFFINLLANSDFAAFRWETPPITSNSIQRPFEFVVVNSLEFNSRSTDANSFKAFFSSDDDDDGIVTFANLGGDATLIVPTPGTDQSAYGHLAAFIRLAPKNQIHAWRNRQCATWRDANLAQYSRWRSCVVACATRLDSKILFPLAFQKI